MLFGQAPTVPQSTNLTKKIPKPEIVFSPKGGFYEDEAIVDLNCPGATIYYTTDGSRPNRQTFRYDKPITIYESTVIRAVAYKGKLKSKYFGHTYFINEPATTFPVVSVSVDPEVLFDPETGLYMKGANVIDSLWKKDGANFWSKREVRAHTEIFETNGECIFNSGSGLRLFGGISRLFPQKSMTIVARDRYGKKRIKHRLFGKEGLKKYKFLVLRNSGSDWGKSHFRDGLMTSLLEGWDIEKQDFRPSHTYINGKYWGIYNIREKINRYFVEGHHEIDKDSIDLIEHQISLKRGSRRHYQKLIKYLKKHDLSDPANYAYVKTQMEVDNFMDYQIAQIFFNNQDAGGNIKFWHPQRPNGKWRWILYDTDWGFGLHDASGYKFNSLKFHTEPEGPSWPNPPWSTFILRKMLEAPEFKKQFVNRFADHLNTTFEPVRVMHQVDSFYTMYENEIERHHDRWKLKRRTWKKHIEIMRKFARLRPEYVRMHMMEFFNTGELTELGVAATSGGRITINKGLNVNAESVFRGKYFERYPVKLKAIPEFGYRFSHWEGMDFENDVHDITLRLSASQPTRLRAVFVPFTHELVDKIIINEVSANNKKTGDWVEIYNNSDQPIQLKDWMLTDNKREFTIPDITLPENEYVVFCQDSISFRKTHNDVKHCYGNLNFGLNKHKEKLALYTDEGAFIDRFAYELAPNDSVFTFGLLLPGLDNSDQENWEINKGIGTPATANPYYLESRIRAEQEMWVRVGVGVGILLSSLLLFRKRKKAPKMVLTTNQQASGGENVILPNVVLPPTIREAAVSDKDQIKENLDDRPDNNLSTDSNKA